MFDNLQSAIDNLEKHLKSETPENVEALKLPKFSEISKLISQIQQLLSVLQAVLPKG